MVTDGIVCAVVGIIKMLKTDEEKQVAGAILEMLCDYDEDEWYSMSAEQKQEWVSGYIGMEE